MHKAGWILQGRYNKFGYRYAWSYGKKCGNLDTIGGSASKLKLLVYQIVS